MIGRDQRASTFVATSVFVFLSFALSAAAGAAPENDVPHVQTVQASCVSLVQGGLESSYVTRARNVADFLDERNIVLAEDDYVSPAKDELIVDGMRIAYRPAVPIVLQIGTERRALRSSAASVADLLASQHVSIGPTDEVAPALDSAPEANGIVRVVRVATWVERIVQTIAPAVRHREDPNLLPGTTRTVDKGAPGARELTLRYVRRGDNERRSVLVTRVIREARARVIAHGIGEYAAFAHLAQRGFESATTLGAAGLHMVATAYTAGCYGCSGITASGVRAGHGIVAVDPRVIPLGTRLFIPGYGRAVAGDTGGAINGRRIDLGFNRLGDALRFGRREITVYVLR